MHHFTYKKGLLYAEDVDLTELAAEIGTPFYCYSASTIVRHYQVLAESFRGLDHAICYAIKANSNQAVIRTLADLGAGMDVVSEGEIRRALAAGVAPEKIVFAGVGKTREEMAFALRAGVRLFNVESEPELELLSEVASALRATAEIALRVNPDVDPRTHRKIATGKAETKFGVPFADAGRLYAKAARLSGLRVAGVHMHIGSQITELEPFRRAFALMRELVGTLRAAGHTIDHVDLGGGLGVPYRGGNDVPPHPDEYARTARAAVGDLGVKLYFEPGRMIVGNAGILVGRVIYVKTGSERTFAIVDAAMNDLIRPTLYDAHHDIWPVRKPRRAGAEILTDVVGPVCETGDYLALQRPMPRLAAGDLIALMTAGAYGAVQAGTYNTRRLVPEVLVSGARFSVVRPRQTYEALIGLDRLADWQQQPTVAKSSRAGSGPGRASRRPAPRRDRGRD
ncbi:MAG: diaminopimelate decarboxylase [Hyphomicrobiaceae bacterium]